MNGRIITGTVYGKVSWTATTAALALAVAAGTLPACAPERTRRAGSPVADPSNPLYLEPGAPAVASDGETHPSARRVETAKAAPVQPAPQRAIAPTPASTPADSRPATTAVKPVQASTDGRAPAIDLEDSGTPSTSERTPKATPSQPSTPPAQPRTTPTREPAVDLIDSTAPATTPKTTPPPAAPVTPEPKTAARTAESISIDAAADHARELILALSRSQQPDVRANAVEAAGLLPGKLESIIVAGLSDTNEGVQAVAAMTIGKQRLASLAPRVRPLLTSSSAYVETAAIMALARNNERVDDAKMSRLGELLFTSQSTRIKSHVAFVVGEMGNASALPMLRDAAAIKMPMAAKGEFNSMLLQFSEAMVKLGDQEQIESIRAALQPGRPDDLEGTAVAVQILGELGDKRPIDQMVYLSAYRDPTSKQPFPAEVRMQVASSLAKLGLDRGGFIADEYVKNEDPALRAQAAGVYGDTGRPEHLPKLILLTEDPVEQVRITAAAAILKIAKKAGVAPK